MSKYHSMNVLVLWLNNYDIVWHVGVGCENESIDQESSYIDKNFNISNCFFSRYLTHSERGGSYSIYINFSMLYNRDCSNWGRAI